MASSRNKAQPDGCLISAAEGMLTAAGIGIGSRVCVALSGGVDSVVLLHVLELLRNDLGYELSAAHVHHGLSTNADAWQQFCASLCASRSIHFHALRVQVARDHRGGVEAGARAVRHAALRGVPADWLVFGHHGGDQAETILFRLVRGSGVRGAGAMVPIEAGAPGRLRPFLQFPRATILRFAAEQALEWIEDESNLDQRYARNRLRHAVLPVLERAFPGASAALAGAAEHFREASGLLDELAEIDRLGCGAETLSLHALLALSDARMRNLLRAQIRALGADAPPRARLAEAVRQLRASHGQPRYLPLGDTACCAYRGQVWLEPGEAAMVAPRTWRGEASLPWGTGQVCFGHVTGAGVDAACLDSAPDVLLTTRWPGMVMCQGRGRPHRSFKNLCQEAGIPGWLRGRLPVLALAGEVVWIAEVGVAAGRECRSGMPGVLPLWVRRTGAR